MAKGLILLGHGSKLDMANKEAEILTSQLDEELDMKVKYANLQFSEPGFWDVLKSLVEDNINEVIIMPLFIFSGRHVNEDIPDLLMEARKKYSDLEFKLIDHLTEDKDLFKRFLINKLRVEL